MEGVLLSALAKLGGKQSIKPLKNAAEKVDLTYHKSNAVGSYIDLLTKLGSSETKTVKKETNRILSKAKKQNKRKKAFKSLLLGRRCRWFYRNVNI